MLFNSIPQLNLTDIYRVIYSYKNLKQMLTRTEKLTDTDEEMNKNNKGSS